ncbi:MAG: hypothetical protein GWN21_12515 [Gammaproteobacteria bacterium]|nr:hypothetical protein [Gammaproteobacteria bacterium]NIV48409.1 hypothetical protein [Gammaproteobacteria bacterium]NIW56040.1 hypothetical protein [Gammaproteobacteria bacterium]NIX05011.1 hypothetical protein [Gammaproteobacteria bacterium]
MNTVIRWTEDQLVAEISGLDAKLNGGPEAGENNRKVANSYLRQLLKDRKEALRLLQFRKAQGMTTFQAQAGH